MVQRQLSHLMGAYFHQDWVLDGGESSDTVTQFMTESAALTSACADELDQLLAQDLAEGGLMTLLISWGCAYRAGDTDDDYRRWLREIRDQIRAVEAR